MKKLAIFTLITMTLTSVSAFAARTTTCSAVDKDGNTSIVTVNAQTNEGSYVKVSKDGKQTVEKNLRIYIMNSNSPGFYYYEGLARAPYIANDAELFRMKLSHDNQYASFKLSTVGGSHARSVTMACEIN